MINHLTCRGLMEIQLKLPMLLWFDHWRRQDFWRLPLCQFTCSIKMKFDMQQAKNDRHSVLGKKENTRLHSSSKQALCLFITCDTENIHIALHIALSKLSGPWILTIPTGKWGNDGWNVSSLAAAQCVNYSANAETRSNLACMTNITPSVI